MGYTGGRHPNPSYHDLGDHTEALQVDFDPEQITYEALMECFWEGRDHDRRAFSVQYRSAVWFADEAQEASARERAARIGTRVTTAIEPLGTFTLAEGYHQKYRLRREPKLVEELVARYGSDEAMVASTAAARINGYLGSYASDREVQALLPLLELSEASAQRLLARLHRS